MNFQQLLLNNDCSKVSNKKNSITLDPSRASKLRGKPQILKRGIMCSYILYLLNVYTAILKCFRQIPFRNLLTDFVWKFLFCHFWRYFAKHVSRQLTDLNRLSPMPGWLYTSGITVAKYINASIFYTSITQYCSMLHKIYHHPNKFTIIE